MERNGKNIDVKKLLEDYKKMEEYKSLTIRRNVYLASENEKLMKTLEDLTEACKYYKEINMYQKKEIQELKGLNKKPRTMKDFYEDREKYSYQKEKSLIPDFSYKKYQN